MSLALTVAILGAGAWVAAVIARAVVHAVHGVIAYFKGFHDGAGKDAVVSKDNPAFVRLGTLLKLTVLSLAAAAVPLVPEAFSWAGGLFAGLGMLREGCLKDGARVPDSLEEPQRTGRSSRRGEDYPQ